MRKEEDDAAEHGASTQRIGKGERKGEEGEGGEAGPISFSPPLRGPCVSSPTQRGLTYFSTLHFTPPSPQFPRSP